MFEVWDLQSLRDKIPRSSRDRDDLINQTRSIDRTKKIVAFQVFKAQEACDVEHLFSNADLLSQQIMNYMLGFGSFQDEFELRRIAAESNMLGAIYHVRSLWEQFAFLVHDMLIEQKLPIHTVDMNKVTKRLAENRSNNPGLVNSLDELLNSDWYQYMVSFTNTIKHRQLIEMHFNVSNQWDGFRFSAFNYKGRCFEQKSSAEIIDGVLEVCNHIIDSGNHLNMAYGK